MDASELSGSFARMSLHELAQMATTDRSQYPQEVIALIEAELALRGVSGLTIDGSTRPLAKDPIQYGGFWRRFGAYWVDALILIPLVPLALLLMARTKYYLAGWVVPGFVFSLWYHVYLVKRFGGTPGKLLMGLRIRKLDGGSVEYGEAILRHVVLLTLGTLLSIGNAMAAANLTDEQYFSTGFIARNQLIRAHAPTWFGSVTLLSQVWIWSEFVVLLTNEKRRALHDFMAGTVVVRRRSDRETYPTSAESLNAVSE